jgi:hypothetical protein
VGCSTVRCNNLLLALSRDLSERRVAGEAVIGRNRRAESYPIGNDIWKNFNILRGVFSKAEVIHYFSFENIKAGLYYATKTFTRI